MKMNYIKPVLIVLIPLLAMFGCGESTTQSNADETGVRIDATMTLVDAGDSVNVEIDTLRDPDCNDDNVFDDPETFTEAQGLMTFSDTPLSGLGNLPQLYITSFCVDYIPQPSPDGAGGYLMPPSLVSWCSNETIVLPASGDVQATISVVPINTKAEYENLGGSAIPYGIYEIRVTFFGKTETGVEFEVVVSHDAHLGDWDNC